MGFCALDRAREPLTGDEIRACWQSPITAEPVVGLFAMVEAMEATEPGSASPGSGTGTTQARTAEGSSGIAAAAAATQPAARFVRRAVSSFKADPRSPDRAAPSHAPRAADGARGTQPVHAPTAGRLVEAPTVTPALRLGSRGDVRALREAEEAKVLRSAAAVDVVRPNP